MGDVGVALELGARRGREVDLVERDRRAVGGLAEVFKGDALDMDVDVFNGTIEELKSKWPFDKASNSNYSIPYERHRSFR